MKKFHLVIGLMLISGYTSAQKQKQYKQLDSIFSMMCSQNQFNGSVLIAEKGVIILKKGYGYSNEETKSLNNPETVFELASCSKQFTAAAIVLLKRQGKLSYNDKLSKYIPELAFWDKVTINDLLRHTSGLPEYIFDMPKAWDKTKIATNKEVINFYADRKDTLGFVPGSRHDYNNTNYALLATIIERTSGKSYADYLSDNIFKPLKMKNTFVYSRRLHPQKINNYAIGYTWARNSFTKVTCENPAYGDDIVFFLDGIVGNAKVNSNVEDVYKWVIALKENTLLTKNEFAEMTAVTNTASGEQIPYGYGLDISKGEGKFAFGHTGRWDGYITFIYHDVPRDRTIITLQNFDMGASLYDNIAQILNGQPLVAEYRMKVSLSETDTKKYVGTYIDENNKEDAQIITYLEGHLIHNSKKRPWDLRFFPVAPNEFQGVRVGGVDGLMRFSTLQNGDIKLEMFQYGQLVGGGIKRN